MRGLNVQIFFYEAPTGPPPTPLRERRPCSFPDTRAIIKHLSADGQSGLGFIVHLGSEDTQSLFMATPPAPSRSFRSSPQPQAAGVTAERRGLFHPKLESFVLLQTVSLFVR